MCYHCFVSLCSVYVSGSAGEKSKYISHLDLIRLWQRALNRAGIPLTYSRGFNPHPQMSMALALAMGVTSEAELMDISWTSWSHPTPLPPPWGSNCRAGLKWRGL